MSLKFNDIVKQFQHNIFGNLTTIRKNQGNIWFIGKEVQELLGYVNISQAIKDAKLKSDEKLVFKKFDNPKFFSELTTQSVVSYGKRSSSIIFISESGLYKLILRSNKPEAINFSDWVTRDVLPFFRKNIEQELVFKKASEEIGMHLDVDHQKFESKRINGINFTNGGVNKIVKYNRDSCLDHSGRTPKQLKTLARKAGLPSKKRSSGKEVLRHIDMPTASAMSLNDNLVAHGIEYDKALKVSNGTGKKLFKELIEIGMLPKEIDL
jgi:prophage antirepressor-like protein